MTTFEKIKSERIVAMKAYDYFRTQTIGSILASIVQYEVDNRKDVDESVVIDILTKMIKQRQESIEQFSKANRTDLVEKEQAETYIIQEFLPKQASAEEIEAIIGQTMLNYFSPTIRDMGKIMSSIKNELNGKADMKIISEMVKAKLAKG